MTPRSSSKYALLLALSLGSGCGQPKGPPPPMGQGPLAAAALDAGPASSLAGQTVSLPKGEPDAGSGLARKEPLPPVVPEKAPDPSPRLADAPPVKELDSKVQSHFAGSVGRRIYLQVDKPLYKPGETIWVKSWDLQARNLTGPSQQGIRYQLISPKGAVVLQKLVHQAGGAASNDFELPPDVQGGEYTLKAVAFDGVSGERPVIVSTYEAPRLKMKLEFVRKAYGEGDEVTATFELKRATGEALPSHEATCAVRLDGQDLPRTRLTTDAQGNGLVRFTLPRSIATGDGLLTVLVEDGGITESVSKRVPIVVKKLQFAAFPEGGKLVEGLPSRLYFEAKNPLGKPADVEGRIVDELGNAVASFSTYKNGLGRVEFTPATGRTYHAEIVKPVGVTEQYALPLPQKDGCVLRSYDDLDGQLPALRVAVRCSESKKVVVTAVERENLLDSAEVQAGDSPAVVYLQPKDEALARAQGVARITVFDDQLRPLAERLVYRNRRSGLSVKVKPDKARYSPREPVSLEVSTSDAAGKPVPAELALSVVDDTVVSFADDKTGHLLSRLLLEPELPGKVEEPNFYTDLTEEKSALAMDLLMGTRGWRTFEWEPVLRPPPPQTATVAEALGAMGGFEQGELEGLGNPQGNLRLRGGGGMAPPPAPGAMRRPMPKGEAPMPPMKAPAPAPAMPKPAEPMADRKLARAEAPKEQRAPADMPVAANKPMAMPAPAQQPPMAQAMAKAAPVAEPMPEEIAAGPRARAAGRAQRLDDNADGLLGAGGAMAKDEDWDKAFKAEKKKLAPARQAMAWAPVRVFPAPAYTAADLAGPRTDFRETIHWAPAVKTDASGKATVRFFLSDAVTSFRVFTEGVGGGLAGRDETVIGSSLPFSMSVKLPAEVSAGDKLLLPLTLSNESAKELDVTLDSKFGGLLTLQGEAAKGGALAAGTRRSLFFPVEVTGQQGESEVRFAARTGSLSDEFVRQVKVTRLGFPQLISRSGKARGTVNEEVDLGQAIPGSADVTLKLYPSPVATLVSGLEGMLREPTGCFEQTSSTNYPNVMVMGYLRSHDVADPALLERSGKLLDSGYRRLTGYESPSKGYEWFGGDPGHEALTAYGLLEFMDMKRVYGNVDEEMLQRTVRWIKGRRDGQGGYLRDSKALDSFGRAAPEVTNAYITYALVRAGQTELGPEVEASARLAQSSNDAYLLALASNTLLRVPAKRSLGQAAARRLAALQEEDGSWKKEDHSITRSGGSNLWIETTALSVLALLEAGGHEAELRKGVEWLQNNRSGFGQWGATQATVLALQAMTAYDEASRKTPTSGSVQLLVNGEPAGQVDYEAGRREPITFSGVGSKLKPGKNTITLVQSGGDGLPYSMAIEFRSAKPATSPESPVTLQTALERSQLKMGETVRLNATIGNKTQSGLPMALARVGLPGGLSFQNWQLKELREKGLIAFYETRPREVILYFRDFKPGETKQIPIDLVASVPGHYTGPASSAYLYYNDQHKTWAEPLAMQIDP